MNPYKVSIKEELAICHWQNVISLGTANCAKPPSNSQ